MDYTSTKIEGQALMYTVEMEYKDEIIRFNVVCAKDEDEIPDLVAHHIEYLKSLSNPS
jgi:hypothetical protein